MDNFEVLARLDEMGYTPDTQVQCHHDAEFMLLSIPDGKRSFKINGDKMTPGISISNSEVGLASLSVSALYFVWCAQTVWWPRRKSPPPTGTSAPRF